MRAQWLALAKGRITSRCAHGKTRSNHSHHAWPAGPYTHSMKGSNLCPELSAKGKAQEWNSTCSGGTTIFGGWHGLQWGTLRELIHARS